MLRIVIIACILSVAHCRLGEKLADNSDPSFLQADAAPSSTIHLAKAAETIDAMESSDEQEKEQRTIDLAKAAETIDAMESSDEQLKEQEERQEKEQEKEEEEENGDYEEVRLKVRSRYGDAKAYAKMDDKAMAGQKSQDEDYKDLDERYGEPKAKPTLRVDNLGGGLTLDVSTNGDGKTFPKAGDALSMHYIGTLTDGTKFDSSRDRGQPFEFKIGKGQVIQGWDRGVIKMSLGERGVLHVPSAMGYGARGAGDAIPPNADLIFDVELLAINGKAL